MIHFPNASSVRWQRWFFLAWLVIVYLWGALSVIMRGWTRVFPKVGLEERFCGLFSQNTGGCVSLIQLGQAAESNLLVLGALTLCLAGFGLFIWINLSKTSHSRFFWLSFLLQIVLALLAATLMPEVEMALILVLMLALEILFLFKRASLVFAVSCGAILLFILVFVATPPQKNIFWLPGAWNHFGPIAVQGALGLAALFLFVAGYLIIYLQWVRAHAQMEMAHRELAVIHEELVVASAQVVTLTRLTERQRLARDLHDTLAQGLAGLIMQLQVAHSCQKEQHHGQAQAIIEQTIRRAKTTLAEARQTIDELRHTSLDEDELKQAIELESAHFTSSTAIPCEMELRMLSALPPVLNEHILYAIKEGLSNIARHAHAHTAWIDVTTGEQSVQVEIGDDGIGFDPATAEQARGHYGLLGLHERATLCGGQLEIVSRKTEGTRLKLSLPLIGEEVFGDEENSCRHCR